EVDKLLDRGAGWLDEHPLREVIVQRYLRHQRSLTRAALERLSEGEVADADALDEAQRRPEEALEARISLDEARRIAVIDALHRVGARAVVDVGCGEGKLLRALLRDRAFAKIAGMDVSHRALERARDRLHLDDASDATRRRVGLFQGSITYRDDRLRGFDAACAVEVIEHLEPERLGALESCLFGHARPHTVIVTTPNREHNVRFPGLAGGGLRHGDHRFEWTREEFARWAREVGERQGYAPVLSGIGEDDPEVGPPTQMAIFTLGEEAGR
ncbi:MAG: 3' terminal RNA ribose 2'-O-methyltransferase Hen1, partial [Myxococcales bacterium]|nr:3' terminal RNA ribose 2'-O-methyltransferase Hen1 [Myxococcales bacterium]